MSQLDMDKALANLKCSKCNIDMRPGHGKHHQNKDDLVGQKLYYSDLSDDIKKKWSESIKAQWDSILRDQYIESFKTFAKDRPNYMNDTNDGENNKFIEVPLISLNNDNVFHKKFESSFRESYISNNYYIKREIVINDNNISTKWDYGIYSKSNNKLEMVINIDGCDYNDIYNRDRYDMKYLSSIPHNIKYCIIYINAFYKSFENMIKDLMLDYDEFINYQFHLCRSIPFPYQIYSDIELFKSYNRLCKLRCDDKYNKSVSINNREGDRIINHFHHSIYSAKCSGFKLSPYDAWYDDELLMRVIKNRIIYINNINPNKILQGFNIAKVAKRVSVFSAGRAKLLIHKYLNAFDTIFDPFSGFSGRMLGATSLNKHYIGQDISPIHVKESNEIIEYLSLGDRAVVSQQNVLKSSGEYDCLFTCPPYSDKEQWYDVPIDTRSCDDWIDECVSRFKCKKYLFVIDNTEKYKNHIVDIIKNRSHMNSNNEYVILIEVRNINGI